MRELKGRLKPFNVIIAFVISVIGQLGLFLYQLGSIPGDRYSLTDKYCKLAKSYNQQQQKLYDQQYKFQQELEIVKKFKPTVPEKIQAVETKIQQANTQLQDFHKYVSENYCPPNEINMQWWWKDHWGYIFHALSIVLIFSLLVGATYLLINNLAQEERQGSLNFIRLSPQSEQNILVGKILGVPILIYLITGLALPFHFLAGRSANIATSHILSFYTVLTAACILFFSAALLFGLVSRGLGGFQPWLGSGAVLIFLIIMLQAAIYSPGFNHAAAWLRMLSPFDMMAYLFPKLYNITYKNPELLPSLQFFYLPIGKSHLSILAAHLVNFSFWNYWVWEGLKRRFRNPNASLISKGQSYLLVTSLQIIFWGFTLQYVMNSWKSNSYSSNATSSYDVNYQISTNLFFIGLFNLVLLIGLVAILSPQRQKIQDWSRYRHQDSANKSLLQDLIWNEKSPSPLAMLLNLVIISAPIIIWIVIAPALGNNHIGHLDWVNTIGRMKTILGIVMSITFMMICVTIAQRMLLIKSAKRVFWAIGIVAGVVFLPLIFVAMLGYSYRDSALWLLTSIPWMGMEKASTPLVFITLLAELSILAMLNYQLLRQVKLAGESATKALLTAK
jgi:hypothetical protein